jgi:hypothetical protein
MPETPPNPALPRRRGAPRGNHNAFKHGYYSRVQSSEKLISLPTPTDQLQPDIALFRGLISRLTVALSSSEMPPSSFAGDLTLLHLVCIAVARINAGRLAELLKDYKNMPFDDVVAASNALNDYLDRIQALSRNFHCLYRRTGLTPLNRPWKNCPIFPSKKIEALYSFLFRY